MEGEAVAGGLAEAWFVDGRRGSKWARVEMLDPGFIFLGLYEDAGCDRKEEEKQLTWRMFLVTLMDMNDHRWAEASRDIAEDMRGQV